MIRAASRATALALCVLAIAAVAGCRRSAGDERLRRGDRLVTATISDPKTFNPLMSVDSASGAATNDLFEGLVRLNQRTTLPEPMLATSWEHDDAGTTWTFHLRPDVQRKLLFLNLTRTTGLSPSCLKIPQNKIYSKGLLCRLYITE